MWKSTRLLCIVLVAGGPAAGLAQESLKPRRDMDASSPGSAARDAVLYDRCKKDAFDFGAMGAYRRLYVLSCLNSDVTSAIPVRN